MNHRQPNEYKCVVLPLARLFPSPAGFRTALCTSCRSKDCGNPIETKTVSILGVNTEIRVHSQGRTTGIVVQCEGYMP